MLKSMQEVLEYAFTVFNQCYFGNTLPNVVISIMSSPRSNGHFTVGKVWRNDADRLHEINISAEHLDRPIENIMATLMHEMIHFYCSINDIRDVTSGGRYHNKYFKHEAEKRDLKISYAQYVGYSVTEPTAGLIRTINLYSIHKPIDLNRDGEQFIMTGTTPVPIPTQIKKKTSTRKYICPCCGNSFRATKYINVICGDCLVDFTLADSN